MERTLIVAAVVLLMSTGAAMAGPCDNLNCAIDEPIVTTPQAEPCGSNNCVRLEPTARWLRLADPCTTNNCAREEQPPLPFQTADACSSNNCCIPEPVPQERA